MINIDELSAYNLKSALRLTISKMKVKYAYLKMDDNEFDKTINNTIDTYITGYKKTNGTLDDYFKDKFDYVFTKITRSKMQEGTKVVEDYIASKNLLTSKIETDPTYSLDFMDNLDKLYVNSAYIPTYKEAWGIIDSIAELRLMLAKVYSNNYCNGNDNSSLFMQLSDSYKTYIEAFCDKFTIDLLSMLTNHTLYTKSDMEYVDTIKKDDSDATYLFLDEKKDLITSLKELFKLDDDSVIKDAIITFVKNNELNGKDNYFTGKFVNDLRHAINKKYNKSAEFDEFVNKYNISLSFFNDEKSLGDAILRGGIYKYLKNFATEDEINKVLNNLPDSYLNTLTQAYGKKSFRYYEYNKNMGDLTKKKLSCVLITIRDFIKYKNGEYSFDKRNKDVKKQVVKSSSTYKKVEQKKNVESTNTNDNKQQLESVNENVKNIENSNTNIAVGVKPREYNKERVFDDLDISKLFGLFNREDAVIIMLKLGLINNKNYSTDEIARFFRKDNLYVLDTVNKFLNFYKEDVNALKKVKSKK